MRTGNRLMRVLVSHIKAKSTCSSSSVAAHQLHAKTAHPRTWTPSVAVRTVHRRSDDVSSRGPLRGASRKERYSRILRASTTYSCYFIRALSPLLCGTEQTTRRCAASCCTYCINCWRKEAASLAERNNKLAHSLSYRDPHFGLVWSLELLLGYLATSGAKSDVIFLLGDPDFR